MLDKLIELEDGEVLFDGEVKELFELVENYMKSCYLYNENGEDKYYFKLKGMCFSVEMSYAQDRTYWVKKNSSVLPEECIDLEDIIKGVIRDDSIRERKEKLDIINATLQGLKEAGVSQSLIRRAVRL